MTVTYTTPLPGLRLAATLSKRFESEYAGYLAEVDNWRAQGYRAHYCEHGTNLWVEYDPICGPCEDVLSMGNAIYRRTVAIDSAKASVRRATAELDLARNTYMHAKRMEMRYEFVESLRAVFESAMDHLISVSTGEFPDLILD